MANTLNAFIDRSSFAWGSVVHHRVWIDECSHGDTRIDSPTLPDYLAMVFQLIIASQEGECMLTLTAACNSLVVLDLNIMNGKLNRTAKRTHES